MSDICQRCGVKDEDCRTLSMACGYAMEETGLPFKEAAIHGVVVKQTGEELLPTLKIKFPIFETAAEAEAGGATAHLSRFFTLRVCKDCRADWMGAIKAWFETKPVQESCGSGIFVRRNGATVEISEEEWKAQNPDREPVRLKEEPA